MTPMNTARIVACIAYLIVAESGVNAFGCSYNDGYLPPTNYDSVKEADAIILANGVALDKSGNQILQWTLTINTLEVIKGTFVERQVSVPAVSSCYGYDFQSGLGMRLLLFLHKIDGTWFVFGSPLGRIGTEYSGANGPWETVVRHYVRIGQFNNYDQEKAALRDLQKAARAPGKNYPAGLGEDIEDYFERPYPTKSYGDLLGLYNKGNTEQRRDVLWAFARGKHKEARPLMQSLMRSFEFLNYIGPITAYVNATEDYASIDPLGGAYLGIKDKQTRWPIMNSLIRLARQQNMGLMIAVLKAADTEEAGRLSEWFVRHPDDQATQMMQELAGSQFDKNWELALSLSSLGDKAVMEYVRKTLEATQGIDRKGRRSLVDDPVLKRGLALHMLARSPLPEADALVREIISRGNVDDLADLCDGLLSSPNPNRWERLRSIQNLKTVDEARGHAIRETLEDLAKDGDQNARDLLATLK